LVRQISKRAPVGWDETSCEHPALDQLARSVEAIQASLTELSSRRLPALEGGLDELRALLAPRRKDFYLVEEVAALAGRSEYTVRRWVAEGKLRATRLAEGGPRGRLLIPRAEMQRLIATGKGDGIPDTVIDQTDEGAIRHGD
jgi:excisionase family DNA binding protein